MTRKSTRSQSVVERLLEQQRQYQDWLEKLAEESAGSAPSHVTQRVQADYAARLDEVTRELGEHEDGVRQALAEAESRSEGLTRQHQERTDELTEARLRRQVGEYEEEQYEEIATRCKAALNELSKELATVERDIDRYEEILTLIRGTRKKAEPVIEVLAPPPEPPSPPPAAAEPRERGEPKERAAEPRAPRISQPQPQLDIDEMAFLRSLTGGAAPAKSEGPRPEPHRAEPIPAELPPPVEARKPERPAPAPAPAPPPPAPAQAERRPSESKDGEAGTKKTLVCTECGTKNLPSEWYCEKCGAELAPY